SVCPPGHALDVARIVIERKFEGIYVDANAISPETTREIGELLDVSGARYVDGGIVGPPPIEPGTTRLFLAGDEAQLIANLFEGSRMTPIVVGDRIGSASAIKAAF